MATFTNQATLIFNGQSTSSNVTTGELASGLTLTKTSISGDYGRDDHVAYIVTIASTLGAITGATLTDDLGGGNGMTVLINTLVRAAKDGDSVEAIGSRSAFHHTRHFDFSHAGTNGCGDFFNQSGNQHAAHLITLNLLWGERKAKLLYFSVD